MKSTIYSTASIKWISSYLKTICLLLFLTYGASLHAQFEITWTGLANTDWNVPTNWLPLGLPTPAHNVIIPNEPNDPVISGGSTVTIKSLKITTGRLTIQSNATLTIEDPDGKSIDNSGTITNSGTIKRRDKMAIMYPFIIREVLRIRGQSTSVQTGADIDANGLNISEGGSVTNSGTINIDRVNYGIFLSGTSSSFTNNSGGQLLIGQNAAINNVCIRVRHGCTFNNNGVVRLDQTFIQFGPGLLNTGLFNNNGNGQLLIGQNQSNSIWYGIDNNDTGNGAGVLNNIGGIITIDNVYGVAGIINRGGAELNNSIGGQIDIGQNDGNIAENGIKNTESSSFTNDDGSIKIDNTGKNGILNENSSEFENNIGIILIGQFGPVDLGHRGIYNYSSAIFTNDGGLIRIDNTTLEGIENINGSEFHNNNNGDILIGQIEGNIGEIGILNISGSTITNDASTIKVDETDSIGIQSVNSTFENNNNGLVEIGLIGTIGHFGIVNHGTTAQMINDASSSINTDYEFRNENSAEFTNNGNLYCNNAKFYNYTNGQVGGNGTYTIEGNWLNSGLFLAGNSQVNMIGSTETWIHGSGNFDFYNLTINKSTGAKVLLKKNMQVGNTLFMDNGVLDLGGNDITLNGTISEESATNYIGSALGGSISKTMTLNAPTNVNPGNIGVNITSGQNLGSTAIIRKHEAETINGEEGILRSYSIVPSNVNVSDVTARFYYWDHELNGILEEELAPYRFETGTWVQYEIDLANTSSNFVQTTNINLFPLWTLAQYVAPLPVELLSFTAKPVDNKKVELSWENGF